MITEHNEIERPYSNTASYADEFLALERKRIEETAEGLRHRPGSHTLALIDEQLEAGARANRIANTALRVSEPSLPPEVTRFGRIVRYLFLDK